LKDFDTNPYSEYIDKDGAPKKYFISRSDFWGSTKEVWCKLNNVINKPN
jgi:hypothetical protein